MFRSTIVQIILLAVLSDWCKGADIDPIISNLWSNSENVPSNVNFDSLFANLKSQISNPSSNLDSIFSELKSQNTNPTKAESIFNKVWSRTQTSQSNLNIDSIFSDFKSKNPESNLNIDSIFSDFKSKNPESNLNIDSIFSDFKSKNPESNLNIDSIFSDFKSKNPESNLNIDSIFSDFKSKNPEFKVDIESILSNLRSQNEPPTAIEQVSPKQLQGPKTEPQETNPVGRPHQGQTGDDRPVWIAQSPTIPERVSESPDRRGTPQSQTQQQTTDKTVKQRYPPTIGIQEEKPLYVADFMKEYVTTPSMIYCLNYCTFPLNYPLAQGGVDAIPHEFPHMVALGFGSGSFVAWNKCGGSLISKNFVLTAAHCVDSDSGPPSKVRVGEHDLSKLDVEVPPQDFDVFRIITHPRYNSSRNLYHDIALIELTKDVSFTRAWNLNGELLVKVIWPACLHQGLNVKRYEDENQKVVALPNKAVASGWGNTGFADAPSDILQKVHLDIIDHDTCSILLGTDANIPDGVDERTQVCAGVLAGGVDTCSGDSGGPLQVNNTMFYWRRYCPMEIVGITSLGKFCGRPDTPSIYTKVSHYVPWIESIVWPTVPKTYRTNG